MLGPGNHGALLPSHRHFYDVASSSARFDDANSAVVSTVRHAFVDAWVDPYLDLVSGLVCSEQTAESDLSSLSGSLAKERASS